MRKYCSSTHSPLSITIFSSPTPGSYKWSECTARCGPGTQSRLDTSSGTVISRPCNGSCDHQESSPGALMSGLFILCCKFFKHKERQKVIFLRYQNLAIGQSINNMHRFKHP